MDTHLARTNQPRETIRILLIEDDHGDARLIRESLTSARDAQFELECVERLSAARERLAGGGIQAILLDLTLPDSSGLDTFFQVRACAPHLPITILSGFDDEDVAIRAVREGAQDYLVKGQINRSLLVRALRYAIERNRSEEALRRKEADLLSLLESSEDRVWAVDSQYRLIIGNAAFRQGIVAAFGRAFEPGESVLPDELSEGVAVAWQGHYDRALQGESFAIEAATQFAPAPRYMEYRFTAIRVNDQIVGVTVAGRDITERKLAEEEIRRLNQGLEQRVRERTTQLTATNQQLEAEAAERRRIEAALRVSEGRLRLLIEQANDAIFVENEEDEILDVNSRACELLGYSRAELLAMKVPDLMPPEIRGIPGQVVKNELATGQVFETVDLRKDGTRVPLEISTRRILGVPGHLVLAIARDITARKQAEEAIHTALAKEKELSELRARFIATTSHEFRTPLSTILSSAQLLEQHAARLSQARQTLHLQHIQAAALQMADLLNDILTLARVDAGKGRCQPAPLDLPALCAVLVEEVQITDHGGRRIRLSVQSAQDVALLDEKLLRQILQNLLSNALKYSPPSGVVTFDLDMQDGRATFTIRDQGIGIPEDELAHVFEPFHRASNVVNTPGSGLGMAIVKNSVDLHGGTITVESKLGMGTTVTVRIPIREPVSVAKPTS
jgi:PAS domain S-box-containing protein